MKLDLKNVREKGKLTSEQLAEDIGVSATTIARLEQGSDHKTNIAVAELVANYLGLKVEEVFEHSDLTTLGRGPGTRTSPVNDEDKNERDLQRRGICNKCHMMKPLSGECNCGY